MKSAKEWADRYGVIEDTQHIEELIKTIQEDALCSVRDLFRLACRVSKASVELDNAFTDLLLAFPCRENPTKKSVDNLA